MSGYKTYGVAVLMVVYEVVGYLIGVNPQFNTMTILQAFGLAALRAGVAKVRS